MKSLLGLFSNLAVLSCFVALTGTVFAQGVGNTGQTKENLDLPYDAIGDEDLDEDSPEIIEFYGQNYEGDGIFFTVDKSGSMNDSGELGIAKREIIRNISEFSSRVQFGVVFFDANVVKYPSTGQPAEATPPAKQSAIGWVNGIPPGSGSCCQQGLIAALEFANKASVKRKTVIYVGDGGGTCHGSNESDYLKQTLGVVKAQNYQHAQINTIGVLMSGRDMQKNFLRQLAQSNSGRYTEINR
jgi:Mg-chelatase subunit ChlD